MITLTDYWMGRDKLWTKELTADIVHAAEVTVQRANMLLSEFRHDTGDTEIRLVHSGWRPPAVNSATPGAAARSNHMIGKAVDIGDPDGALDDWCMAHLDTLGRIGLWLEHPASTKGWCHLQTVAPRSGVRVFYP